MYETFIFDHTFSNAEPPVTVVFCPMPDVSEKILAHNLRNHFDVENLIPPKQILLFGSTAITDAIPSLLTSHDVWASLPTYTRHSPNFFLAVSGDPSSRRYKLHAANGTATDLNEDVKSEITPSKVAQLMKAGLRHIFKTRGVELGDRSGWHYIKPSKKHCDGFIRTANAFVRSSEIYFIAFSLLEFIPSDLRHIYTDSSSINVLAYAAIALKKQVSPSFKEPTISSFGSHYSVDDFDFMNPRQSIFFISASTSGELEERLLVRLPDIDRSAVITVLYVGAPPKPRSSILCDATVRSNNEFGWIEQIKSFPAANCDLCQYSHAIEIIGDQFLTHDPEMPPAKLVKKHRPAWLSDFVRSFIGKDVAIVHCIADGHERSTSTAHELYINLDHTFSDQGQPLSTPFAKSLRAHLMQCTPSRLKTIIHVDDLASKTLAELVISYFRAAGGTTEPVLYSHSDLRQMTDPDRQSAISTGLTLVVSSTCVTGRSLMELSQLLRPSGETPILKYLIGVTRTRSKERLVEIKNTLLHGDSSNPEHTFNSVMDIFIPDDRSIKPSPWHSELKLLQRLEEYIAEEPSRSGFIDVKKTIATRMQTIRNANTGLTQKLFWNSIQPNKALELRSGFAYWEGVDYGQSGNIPSQADVYFTMSAVLHEWRSANHYRADARNDYTRLTIEPRTFLRFNDGILQASILRAATGGELNYSQSKMLSTDLKVVLDSVFGNYARMTGEASIEFLLALASQKVRMTSDSMARSLSTFGEALLQAGSLNAGGRMALFLCDFIKNEVLKKADS